MNRSYIPNITLSRLSPVSSSNAKAISEDNHLLQPLQPIQFLLKIQNPLFEPINITLATPSNTQPLHPSSSSSSKVTILCPQFSVGANTDDVDDLLLHSHDGHKNSSSSSGGGGSNSTKDKRLRATTGTDRQDSPATAATASAAAPEAGKIWDRGRNWTTVVVEIIPGLIKPAAPTPKNNDDTNEDNDEDDADVDADLLEIPVFIRVEWEDLSEISGGGGVGMEYYKNKEKRTGVGGTGGEKRELAYWCVLGVGRISSS